MTCRTLVFLFIMLYCSYSYSQKKEYTIHTIAFYNLENLFDPEDDPTTFDDDKTPIGKDRWTPKKYAEKIANMGRVISEIGKEKTKNTPVIVGVAEIENKKVLEDLTHAPSIIAKKYGIVHFDSPDRRGIDVALLYQKSFFIPKSKSVHELILYETDTNKRVYTRDQLLVSGYLDGDFIHIIVNHWPSRRGGTKKSQYKRIKAAMLTQKITDSLFAIDPYSKIIIMGDFNDNPNNTSIKKIVSANTKKEVKLKSFYNPMYAMFKKRIGTLAWNDRWNIFDQIMVSSALVNTDYKTYGYYTSGIYAPEYLTITAGKYKGYPFRAYNNNSYTGGYSDHFPVYIYLIKQKE